MSLRVEWRGRAINLGSPSSVAARGAHGRGWYQESGASVAAYAARWGLSAAYVADVVAILSPRVSVSQNVKLAREYLETGSIERGVMRSRLRALSRYEADGVVSGPKVRAFSAALQGDPTAVVVDAWMLRLYGLRNRPADLLRADRRVRALARSMEWTPAETQAALWVGLRGACGFVDDYSPLTLLRGPLRERSNEHG